MWTHSTWRSSTLGTPLSWCKFPDHHWPSWPSSRQLQRIGCPMASFQDRQGFGSLDLAKTCVSVIGNPIWANCLFEKNGTMKSLPVVRCVSLVTPCFLIISISSTENIKMMMQIGHFLEHSCKNELETRRKIGKNGKTSYNFFKRRFELDFEIWQSGLIGICFEWKKGGK